MTTDSVSTERVQVSANVLVTLSIDVGDVWDGDCGTSQIFKQAKDSAYRMLNQLLGREAGRIKIVGIPSIKTVIVSQEQ